ncbi:MAG: acylphosphatase [Caldithrix sp.]|nr:MAG: acylphosphatase [Caldithrix sp.]
MEVCAKIIVKGRVQGVGFRWFVQQQARNFGVSGYVRNLGNGDVEIEAEGDRGRVEELLKSVRVGPTFSKVREVVIEWQKFTAKYYSFNTTF